MRFSDSYLGASIYNGACSGGTYETHRKLVLTFVVSVTHSQFDTWGRPTRYDTAVQLLDGLFGCGMRT